MTLGPLMVLASLGLSAGTVMLLVLAIAGRRDPAQPRCTSCRCLLEAGQVIEGSKCPLCHADLGGEKAIRPRWRPAGRRVWISLAVLCLLWPAGIGLVAYLNSIARKQRVLMPVPAAPPVLVSSALRESPQSFGAGESLRMLLSSGDLTTEEFRKLLLAELRNTSPTAGTPDRSGTRRMVGSSLDRKPNDDELLDAMLEYLEPAPTPVAELSAPIGRNGRRQLMVVLTRGPESANESVSEEIHTALVLRRITVDGKEIPIRLIQSSRQGPCALCTVSKGFDSFLLDGLAPGKHAIELELTADVYDSFDGMRLLHMNHCVPVGAEPPKPMRSTPRRASLTLEVDDEGRPVVPPAPPPSDDATTSDAPAPTSDANEAPIAP